jgi:hypothetical protein
MSRFSIAIKISAFHFDPGGEPEHLMTEYERVLILSPGENDDGWQGSAGRPRRELPNPNDGVTNIIKAFLRNKTATDLSIMEGNKGNPVPGYWEKRELPRGDRRGGIVTEHSRKERKSP